MYAGASSRVCVRVSTALGRAGVVYNGIPDWTYENVPELNGRSSGLAFSPDGLFLAFLTFNDSDVNEYK